MQYNTYARLMVKGDSKLCPKAPGSTHRFSRTQVNVLSTTLFGCFGLLRLSVIFDLPTHKVHYNAYIARVAQDLRL